MTELFTAGDVVGGFRVERILGRGGMGVIYLAEQPSLRRFVALKVITPMLANDPIFRARFEREAHHAASIDHPNVVPIYAAGEDGSNLYIAMRYVEGRDLGGLVREQGSLELSQAVRIANDVASALDAAHAHGLIHRDVKPENILLAGGDSDGHVYLTDFGLMKEIAAQSQLTNTGNWVGTVDYVAPEQIRGDRVDARADIYALGCVLYEMLSGRPPFEGHDARKIWGHLNGGPPSISSIDPVVARSVDPVIARAMAKAPSDRYPSAGDLGRAAIASASHRPNSAPERSVATGVAATGIEEQRTIEYEPPAQPGRAPDRDEPTRVLQRTSTHSRRRTRAVAFGAIAAIAIASIAAAAILLGQTGDDPATTQPESVETTTTTTTTATEAGSATAVSSTAPAQYVFYAPSDTDFGYGAKLPNGNGWSRPVETMPYSSELLRTTVRGPDGSFLLIDRTPNEEPTISGYESVQQFSQPTYGKAKEYVISNGEAFPECADVSCVDIQMVDGAGGGWGILAGGPNVALSKEVAARVAQSIFLGD